MRTSPVLALVIIPILACSSSTSHVSSDSGSPSSGSGSGEGSGSGRGTGSGSGSSTSHPGDSGAEGGTGSGSASGSGSGTGGGSGSVPFTALHTYHLSPTGSDSNAGTSAASPWKTPNHALACGDVILAAPGNYATNQFVQTWGAVSGCPSTTGGIDGNGGVYFATLLCAGTDLTSCTVDGGAKEAFRINASNWAVEGFSATQEATASEGGFATG